MELNLVMLFGIRNKLKWLKVHFKWTEDDRDELAQLMRYISKLLSEAKVDDITKLAGKPVEVTIDEFNSLKSWRILTEVL